MYLYFYHGYTGGRALSETLVQRAYRQYLQEEGPASERRSPGIIKRTDRGKPYFTEGPCFSVSHTGQLWVCSMGRVPVGIDVQKTGRRLYWKKIAERYYTDDERAHIEECGIESFFQIWTRKEAYAKYTGQGIDKEFKTFSTLQSISPCFTDLFLGEDVKASCCMERKEEIWIRKLV